MQRAWHGHYGSDGALATLKQAHIAHKVTCVRQCCNYQNPKVVGYVVAVSFVELSTQFLSLGPRNKRPSFDTIHTTTNDECTRESAA
jgi:hypothetical protein